MTKTADSSRLGALQCVRVNGSAPTATPGRALAAVAALPVVRPAVVVALPAVLPALGPAAPAVVRPAALLVRAAFRLRLLFSNNELCSPESKSASKLNPAV